MRSEVEATSASTQHERFARRHEYVTGTPIFDAIGLWVGNVDTEIDSKQVQAGGTDLIMRSGSGWHARQRVPIPLATITRVDPDGIYLDTYNTHPPII